MRFSNRELGRGSSHDAPFGLVGHSSGIRGLRQSLEVIAGLRAPVLIEGPSGAGKSALAQAIHHAGAGGPWLSLDCRATAPERFEIELFGSPELAALGEEGLLRRGAGGSLWLEEVPALASENQNALARFLESGRLPGHGDTRIDCRILATSSLDLCAEAEAGRVSESLYFLLRTFSVRIPSLGERRDDLAELVDQALRRSMLRFAKEVSGLSPEAEAVVHAAPWPGDLRQLEEEMERAVVLTPEGEAVPLEVLSPRLLEQAE